MTKKDKEIPVVLQMAEGEPDTDEELRRRERASALRRLSPALRAKAKRDSQRKTMTYDLPDWIIDRIRAVSGEESIAQSRLVSLAILEWLDQYYHDEVDLQKLRIPTRSLRYLWTIEFSEPDDWPDASNEA